MASKKTDHNPHSGYGASPGLFVQKNLRWRFGQRYYYTFVKYFEKYGEITGSVIMKDRQTGRPRGFSTLMSSMENGSKLKEQFQREANDFKTKKIFVGGIPTSVDEMN